MKAPRPEQAEGHSTVAMKSPEENAPNFDELARSEIPTLGFRYFRKVARQSRNLTGQEFRLLDAIMDSADWNGKHAGGNAFPRRKVLAEKIGRSVRTVDDLLTRLEAKGWLRRHPCLRQRDGRRTSDLYQFRLPRGEGLYDEDGAGWEGPIYDKRKGVFIPDLGHALWRGRTLDATDDAEEALELPGCFGRYDPNLRPCSECAYSEYCQRKYLFGYVD